MGATVGVKGYMNEDGSVFASELAIVGEATPRPAEGRGTVTAVLPSAGCPALQFMIGPYTVAVDGATQFMSGSCRESPSAPRWTSAGRS